LWNPTYRAWFPEGKGDREATVIRVAVERIDYWEPTSSRVIRLVQAAKAVLTRRAVETPMKTLDGL
jgi:general stress protein 26